MPLVVIKGPRDTGPGERELMMEAAADVFAEAGASSHVRIDVPGRGSGEEPVEGQLREALHPIVPALQSGSLFDDTGALLVVDTQNVLKAEAEVIDELIRQSAVVSVTAAFLAVGAVPAPLGATLEDLGTSISVKKMRERDAAKWIVAAARERSLRVDQEAAGLLVHRFGSDVAAMGRALDQLAIEADVVTAEMVRDRFKNRPDEPTWYYTDAVAKGDEGEALRRLEDLLLHGHPLQVLAVLEGEVRRRALASAASDIETYAQWVGSKPSAFPVRKAWDRRLRSRPEELRRCVDALTRADLQLKTAPEATHRLTLERLTVALCRWLGR